ncbi:MAG: energy-coupling factor transporter ATPase [Firmicutes bacterium]|jgi:energy-coupling factor transport system ATP-binding protein|nr:energy-coupling factor transporter ATPase [Bacillota bacterium]HPU00509.1 energy-coupling factor transporter ATPase [Bacillota bacterium]
MKMIEGENISHAYDLEGSVKLSLEGVSITVQRGELVAILGPNGSGKSTLAKHFNALLPLQQGSLAVAGLDARDSANLWEIRRRCGMVFQNPDNQFVSSVVEEDIAFGLENFGTPPEQVPLKIEQALQAVGMSGYEQKSPHMLSGGQKQRVALAGVLAVEPEIIIFDEATTMLDPEGRRELMETIRRLHREHSKTIILITHYLEEAVISDRVYLLKEGRVVAQGTPREILTDRELLAGAGLLPPLPVQLYYDLKEEGIVLERCPLTSEELVEELAGLCL